MKSLSFLNLEKFKYLIENRDFIISMLNYNNCKIRIRLYGYR